MIERMATIRNEQGIHCRPSSAIIKTALPYPGKIQVIAATGTTELRSVVELLMLGLEPGRTVKICVEGPDEELWADRFVELFERHFDFPPLENAPSPQAMDAALHTSG